MILSPQGWLDNGAIASDNLDHEDLMESLYHEHLHMLFGLTVLKKLLLLADEVIKHNGRGGPYQQIFLVVVPFMHGW